MLAFAQSGTPQGPANLDFRAGETGQVPPGWFVPPVLKTAGFSAELRREGCRSAIGCAVVTVPPAPPATGFGNLMQTFSAAQYRGATVRVRAWVRLEAASPGDQARLWFRVDRPGRLPGFFDNMQDRPVTSADWQLCEIVGPVAADALVLNLGVTSHGHGRPWVDTVSLDIVDNTVQETGLGSPSVTPRGPVNLNFRDGQPGHIPDRWSMMAAHVKSGNSAELRRENCRGTIGCAVVIAAPNAPSGNQPAMYQDFLAERYRGKTVRFRAWLRAEPRASGDAAQLLLQVLRHDGQLLFANYLEDRPVQSSAWQPAEIVAKVAQDAYYIKIGVISHGRGQAWIDDAGFEIVPDATQVTGGHTYGGPANIDFAEGEVGRTPSGWATPQVSKDAGYVTELRREGCWSGAGCGVIRGPDQLLDKRQGALTQTFYAEAWRGKTVRLRARVRVDAGETSDAAQLFLTAMGNDGKARFHHVADDIRSAQWMEYEVTGKIDEDARVVAFGLTFSGKGFAWIDGVTFEVVPE